VYAVATVQMMVRLKIYKKITGDYSTWPEIIAVLVCKVLAEQFNVKN
jgi:hypothetical protein